MTGARRGTNSLVVIHESEVTPIGDQLILPDLDMSKVHCFLGVQFFTSIDGDIVATPTTGTITIKIKTYNTNLFELMPEGSINAASPSTINWAANTIAVLVVPSNIDVATHYKAILTCNES